jgi:hypothetical protein
VYRSVEQIEKEIEKLTEKLKMVALADANITEDEQNLLDIIELKIKSLKLQVIQILESDIDDDEFDDILTDLLDDIIHEVEKVAKQDGKITQEEQDLIDVIEKFVKGRGLLHD